MWSLEGRTQKQQASQLQTVVWSHHQPPLLQISSTGSKPEDSPLRTWLYCQVYHYYISIYLTNFLFFSFLFNQIIPMHLSSKHKIYIRNVERAKREFRYKIDRRDFPVIYLIYTHSKHNCGLWCNATTGAHTIGQARCTVFRTRIYNETNIEASFARKRQGNCPLPSGSRDNNLAPLDHKSPTFFDNAYYKNLIDNKGLLHSDQILYNGGSTDSLIETYSKKAEAFSDDFAAAMIRMGDISPLTGSNGEIRKNCRRANWEEPTQNQEYIFITNVSLFCLYSV